MPLLKKFFSKDPLSDGTLPTNGGFSSLKPELQERLACGVKYNMKLVIRGDRKTGKSTLLSRIKGEGFSPTYIPTDEIQVACILWNYQPTDDVVKVDVWDVVDKGRQREVKHGTTASGYISRLKNKSQTTVAMVSLDSTFIDVYKGANCVFLIFDLTSKWTFEYIRRELPKVPHSVPVLLVGNFRDAVAVNDTNREITETEVRSLIRRVTKMRQVDTPSSDSDSFVSDIPKKYIRAPIRYCETSMQNGFGLMYIHRFLNIPFLHLQCSYLVQALATNRQAFSTINQELDLAEENREAICSYEKFVRWLENPQGAVSSLRPSVENKKEMGLRETSKISTVNERVDGSRKGESSLILAKSGLVKESHLPPIDTEDVEFHEFLLKSDTPSPNIPLPTDDLDVTVETNETCPNGLPLVAAFQEDIDPDDVTINGLSSLFTGPNGNGDSLHPLGDSVDDDPLDEDDDDLMNADDDDDEEQLGPALGLASLATESVDDGHSSAKTDGRPQMDKFPDFVKSSCSSSPTSVSNSPMKQTPPPEPIDDLGTLEERSAFERFLDDI